jgi:hypothetical protein
VKRHLVCALMLLINGTFLLSCASNETLPCATTDWYELGRRHGTRGALENEVQNLKFACANEDEKGDAMALYESGRSLGLAEYCTEENGFEMGRTGQKYLSVCPVILEEAFMVGYKRGSRASDIQSINEKLKKPGLSFARKGLLEGQKLQMLQEQEKRSIATAQKSEETVE